MKLLCLALLIATPVPALSADLADQEHPRTPKRVWIRRATLAAACAASLAFDTLSTRSAVAGGAVEGNALFANAQGKPQWGRMIGIKSGFCGVTAMLQETHVFHAWQNPDADWSWTAINSGTAAFYSWAGWHNLQIKPAR